MISQELITALQKAGLNNTQITSQTARVMIDVLMPDDGKLLMKEAKEAVSLMHKQVWAAKEELDEIRATSAAAMSELESITTGVKEILEAEEQFKGEGDERVRNALLLYSAMLNIGGKSEISLTSAGYATYAYLGGQSAYLAVKEANKFADDQNDNELRIKRRK